MALTLLALIVVLGVLIFVHELGHFVAAKWAGIYVHRFALGIGSPIPGLTFRRGETEYSICWLPLGGYVKMASREEGATSAALEGATPEAAVPPDRVFEAKPVWKRMIVILAGVTMNVLFAWLAYVFLAAKNGRATDPTTTVGRVEAEMLAPATRALAELKTGDRIVAINGDSVHSWDEIQMRIGGGSDRETVLALADGRTVRLDVHPDALVERANAAQALLPFQTPVIDSVAPNTPAARAGLAAGDTLLRVGDRIATQWYDVVDVLEKSAGRPVEMVVRRGGQDLTLSVTPRLDTVPTFEGKTKVVGRIGVNTTPRPIRYERLGFLGAVREGTNMTVGSLDFMVRTVRGLVSRRVDSSNLGGPILIAQQAGQAARLGLDIFLGFMALVSVNLAVLNLLPVPVLDGGQFVFLVAEAVLRRPLALKLRERLTAVGLVLILLLMVFAFSNDIRRLLGLL